MKFRLLILTLLCIGLIFPVLGYTEQWSGNYLNLNGQGDSSIHGWFNMSMPSTISKMVFTANTVCAYWDGVKCNSVSGSRTFTGHWVCGGVHVGNVSTSYSGVTGNSTRADVTYTTIISDANYALSPTGWQLCHNEAFPVAGYLYGHNTTAMYPPSALSACHYQDSTTVGACQYSWDFKVYSGADTINRNITIIVKNLANSALPNVNVGLFLNDGTYSDVDITNSSGMVSFLNVPVGSNSSVEITTAATGIYSAYHEDFNFDSSPMNKTIYLTPVSPSGNYSNITYQVTDALGSPILSAYIDHKINQNYELIDLTDSNGRKTFYNVPVVNNGWFYTVYKSGYQDFSAYVAAVGGVLPDIQINVSLQGGGIYPTPTITPTPIITPPIGLTWSLSANPPSILLGGISTLWLTAPNSIEYNKANHILYYENDNLGAYSGYKLIGTYTLNSSTSNWDYKDKNGVWSYTSHDFEVLEVRPMSTGTYNYKAIVYDNGTWPYTSGNVIGQATTSLVIGGGAGGGENLVCVIASTDGKTGFHLSDWSLTLTDTITGASNTWNNISYDKTVSLVRGREYLATANKFGYLEGSKTITPPLDQNVQTGDLGAIFNIPLFKSGDLSTGNTTVMVTFIDMDNYQNMPNALIQVTGQTSKYTGTNGEPASFILPFYTEYTATGSKEGYCGASTFRNTSNEGYQYVYIYAKFGACQGVTPTHTPIPNQTTVRPTITPIHYGNLTEPAICDASITLVSNHTWVQKGLNYMACMGFVDSNQQKLTLAIIPIIIFGVIFGRKAGGAGVLGGIGIGVVLDTAAGFIDAWIFFAFVIIAAIILGMKLMNNGGGS